MTSLLTLDHTTLFFYTLSLSSQRHTTSVEHWRSKVDKKFNSNSNSIHPGPSLTHASTRSSTTSTSKRRYDTGDPVIDLCGPTPKKPRTYGSRTVANAIVDSNVKVGIDYEDHDWYGGGLSDRDEMNGSEAVAARLSPFKNGARATNSVSTI